MPPDPTQAPTQAYLWRLAYYAFLRQSAAGVLLSKEQSRLFNFIITKSAIFHTFTPSSLPATQSTSVFHKTLLELSC